MGTAPGPALHSRPRAHQVHAESHLQLPQDRLLLTFPGCVLLTFTTDAFLRVHVLNAEQMTSGRVLLAF